MINADVVKACGFHYLPAGNTAIFDDFTGKSGFQKVN
jgi:hypothetical protein